MEVTGSRRIALRLGYRVSTRIAHLVAISTMPYSCGRVDAAIDVRALVLTQGRNPLAHNQLAI